MASVIVILESKIWEIVPGKRKKDRDGNMQMS